MEKAVIASLAEMRFLFAQACSRAAEIQIFGTGKPVFRALIHAHASFTQK